RYSLTKCNEIPIVSIITPPIINTYVLTVLKSNTVSNSEECAPKSQDCVHPNIIKIIPNIDVNALIHFRPFILSLRFLLQEYNPFELNKRKNYIKNLDNLIVS